MSTNWYVVMKYGEAIRAIGEELEKNGRNAHDAGENPDVRKTCTYMQFLTKKYADVLEKELAQTKVV